MPKIWRHTKEYLDNWNAKNYPRLVLKGAKTRAKRDGIPFDIDLTDINIPAICPVLKIPIQPNKGSGWHDSSPSLDRIHNSKGYTKGNVRVISNRANRLKADATLSELKLIVEDAHNFGY